MVSAVRGQSVGEIS